MDFIAALQIALAQLVGPSAIFYALLAIGIVLARPIMEAPAISQFADKGTGPVFAGALFPFLFITIACGAVSGFHALISSGTTPKLLANEAHMRYIGYGGMLMMILPPAGFLVLGLLLAAGIGHVVVGHGDPNPQVRGGGLRRLRAAGVRVEVGVLEAECREQHRGFLCVLEKGRPFVALKLAATLDGRIATARGESRWITGPAARALVHRLRARADAVVIGSKIIQLLGDQPRDRVAQVAQNFLQEIRNALDS